MCRGESGPPCPRLAPVRWREVRAGIGRARLLGLGLRTRLGVKERKV